MKKKILVILECMLIIASTMVLITPEHFKVKAIGGGSLSRNENTVGINTTYIHLVTQELSNIVNTFDRGRSFGTQGELDARDRIEDWMDEIGLYNVHTDEINGTTQHNDLNATIEILSKGIKINGTQTITDCYISQRWNQSYKSGYDKSKLSYNFSENDSLPVYIKPSAVWFDNMFDNYPFMSSLLENFTLGYIYDYDNYIDFLSKWAEKIFNFTYEEYNESDPETYPSFYNGSLPGPSRCNSFLYIDEDPSYNPNSILPSGLDDYEPLSIPRIWFKTAKLALQMRFWYNPLFPGRCKGLILYDFNEDTYDMTNGLYMPLPILYVNGSIGRPIYENATNTTPSNREISFWINQRYNTAIKSYNVIGQINGTNPNKTVLCDCLYDCWWNQGTADAAIGMGTVLALAKYFKDYNITPKYTLKFVAFGGEEYGYLGAQHYNDTHINENITMVIDLNQIGFSQTGPLPQTFFIHLNNASLKSLIQCIANETYYNERTGTPFLHIGSTYYGAPSDDHPFAVACLTGNRSLNTICFLKDLNWTLHHRDGQNHEKGDVMTYYNETDVNVTAEMIWNITKYFTVDPDCWFDNVTFTAFDSPNDGDSLNDSIRANFTIHSVLPSDKVRVELDLGYESGGVGSVTLNAESMEYTLTSRSQNESFVFTIPDDVTDCYYNVTFKLYNSTGRINKIVYGPYGIYYNDITETSEWYHLFHPLGYTKIGEMNKCIDDNISGSVFTANEYGTADNITVYIDQNFVETTHYKCMLYRANDSVLIGTTTENWFSLGGKVTSPWWAVLNFTGTKPQLIKGTDYVITCWGDSAFSYVYYNESESNTTGRYDAQSYGAPPNPADFTNESRYYSIYCSYTPDTTGPQITGVTASPHIVGFGYNVTITANVTDECSGINQVTVQIGYPGGKTGNFTMTHSSNDTYQYIFSDTWIVGQYNYTIRVTDNSSNMNSSTGHHFNVSAEATISIATLQDSYTGSQYINITDPPNPPENYNLVDRGLTWDEYYNNETGQNILEVSTGPVNYQNDSGTWTPINNTISSLSDNHSAYVYGYRSGNNQGLYGVYFKSNAQLDWPVAFTYNQSDDPTVHAVRSKLVGVGYVDPQSNWTYEYLQNVQSSQGQTNNYSITYPSVFTGTDVTWSYGNTGLKEEITLSNTTKSVLQNHPPSQYGLNDASSYLVFITKLDYQNLDLYNGSGLLDGNVTISDAGVEFKDALGQFRCALPLGEAYELNNESVRQKLTYRIIHLNGNTYLLSGLKLSDLNTMNFPVVIDPTLSINSLSNDGLIYNSRSSYNDAWAASTGTISSSATYLSIGQWKTGFPPTYTIYRSFILFNTSTIPSNAYLDNATVSLYKKDDYSATDFTITIQNGQPTYPHNPLQAGDYAKGHYSANGGGLNTTSFMSERNNITLTDISWINTTGTTKLCLRSSRDITGTMPTGSEFVNVYSTNAPLGGYVPKLIISYRNQSKIKNTGSTDIKGYLLIQVQYYNETLESWIIDNDTINETTPRTITSGNQLALDTIFNGQVRTSDLTPGTGTYRVYVAFRSPDGNILKTNDERELVAWWEFLKT